MNLGKHIVCTKRQVCHLHAPYAAQLFDDVLFRTQIAVEQYVSLVHRYFVPAPARASFKPYLNCVNPRGSIPVPSAMGGNCGRRAAAPGAATVLRARRLRWPGLTVGLRGPRPVLGFGCRLAFQLGGGGRGGGLTVGLRGPRPDPPPSCGRGDCAVCGHTEGSHPRRHGPQAPSQANLGSSRRGHGLDRVAVLRPVQKARHRAGRCPLAYRGPEWTQIDAPIGMDIRRQLPHSAEA